MEDEVVSRLEMKIALMKMAREIEAYGTIYFTAFNRVTGKYETKMCVIDPYGVKE